ncbi:hypothetical protein F2Q68_00011621 [Brassica cretica]|uniref:Uncharacterized protein n=1 Tax=Brassica cretica TaxID=69181 RepID=A0A8S9L2Y2_BRACR|nr:hypothetical protein F2Q68_00011621 [Brassica cretica]
MNRGKENDGCGTVRMNHHVRIMNQTEPSASYVFRKGRSVHQYGRRYVQYEPIEPKEESLDHFVKPHYPSQVWHDLSQVWHDLSQVWLGYQSWLVEWAGRDGLQFGQFEHMVEDLDAGRSRVEPIDGPVDLSDLIGRMNPSWDV